MKQEDFELKEEIGLSEDVETSFIAESVRSFTGQADLLEEMELYEDNPASASHAEHHVKANTGVIKDLELLPEDDSVPVTMAMPGTGKIPETVGKTDRIIPGDETENLVLYPDRPYVETEAATKVIPTVVARDGIPTKAPRVEEASEGLNFAALEEVEEYERQSGEATDISLTGTQADLLENLAYHDEDVPQKKKRPAISAEEPEEKAGIKVNGAKSREDVKKHSNAEAAKHGSSGKNASHAQHGQGSHSQGAHSQGSHSSNSHGQASHKSQAVHAGAAGGSKGSASKGGHSGRKEKRKFQVMDGVMIGVAAIILITVVVLGIVALNKVKNNKNVGTIASVGVKLSSIEGIGQPGIQNIIANKEISVIESVPTSEETNKGTPRVDVTVNFSSIEKDLKIKFIDKATEKLITGVAFKVEARTPDKKTVTWEDTDKDGVIYNENMVAGTYYVKVLNVDDFEFPDKETEVTVKDKISYVAINVMDEVKKASEVDLKQEDQQGKEVDKGEVLADTVAWVNSATKSVYEKIDRAKVKEPVKKQGALKFTRNISAEGALEKIEISGEGTVKVGDSIKLTATLTPTNPDNVELVWESDNEAIATVSDGTVTGVASGSVKITCKDKNNENIKAEHTVEVTEEKPNPDPTPIPVTGITLDKESLSLTVGGDPVTLVATISPTDATDKEVTWESSKPEVATVDSNGKVTAVAEGETIITCKSKSDNSITKTCKVTVAKASVGYIKSLKLKDSKKELFIGETYKVEPEIAVEGENVDQTVTWETANDKVATVKDGVVTAVAAGTAKITCTTKTAGSDGKQLKAECEITVVENAAAKDTTTPLKDTDGNQLYVKDGDNYREAKSADYYNANIKEFYVKKTVYTGWQTVNGATKYYKEDGNYVTGEQVIGGVKYNFASDGTLSMGGGTLGIDVSQYNGTINWNAVKAAGVSFVIIRCGFRGYTKGGLIEDTNFHSYASGAQAAGLKVGVYFFSQAINEKEAVEEASMAVAMAKQHKISYPIFIDSEYANGSHTGRADKLTKAQRTAVCKAFCETVKSAGYTPGVYASKFWYYDNLDASALNSYKIWLAHYTKATDYKGKYELWQNSCTGKINGINGNVDINTSYLGY